MAADFSAGFLRLLVHSGETHATMVTVPLSQLIERQIRIEPAEAIAIAQLLASAPGVPAIENIEIDSDGDARCRSTEGEPTVAALAAFLDRVLPRTGVPGGLRYAIARGLGAVEAPPFVSVREFSQSLMRFETGTRDEIIRGLMSRARPVRPPRTAPVATAAFQAAAPPQQAKALPQATPAPAAIRPHVATSPPTRRVVMTPIGAGDVLIVPPAEATVADMPSHARRRRGGLGSSLVAAAAIVLSAITGYEAAKYFAERHSEVQASQLVPPPAGATSVSEMKPDPALPQPAPTLSSDGPVSQTIAHRATTPALHPATTPLPARVPVRALPAMATPAFSPAFSSNGTALFFQTGGRRDPASAIAMAAADGGPSGDLQVMTIVDDGARNYHAQPSPDGRFIAFDSDRDGVRGVYVAQRDGSHVRRISGEGYAALPTWSPDGTRLTFVRAERDAPSVWNLWLQPLDGGDARRLTGFHYGQTWAASWFPDGRRIAYSHEAELTILDLQTGRPQHFASPVRGTLVRTPAVSPDGSRIVFQVFRAGAWMMNVADGSMQCVLEDPTAEEFAWAPDGRRFAFHSRRDGKWSVYMLSTAPAAP